MPRNNKRKWWIIGLVSLVVILIAADAKKHRITGKAIVEFTIEKNGKVSDFKVVRGLCNSIKQVCYDLFKNMPDWSPGTQNAVPVRVAYTLPITFNLE